MMDAYFEEHMPESKGVRRSARFYTEEQACHCEGIGACDVCDGAGWYLATKEELAKKGIDGQDQE